VVWFPPNFKVTENVVVFIALTDCIASGLGASVQQSNLEKETPPFFV
jgi:hypothetical protein